MEAPEKDKLKREIEKLSWLSRIEVAKEEEEEVIAGVRVLLKLVERILEAPVENVPPLYHPLGITGRLREDSPEKGLSQEEALANAADTEEGFIKAPRTVED